MGFRGAKDVSVRLWDASGSQIANRVSGAFFGAFQRISEMFIKCFRDLQTHFRKFQGVSGAVLRECLEFQKVSKFFKES